MNPKTLLIAVALVVVGLIVYSIATAPPTDDRLMPSAGSNQFQPQPPEIKEGGKQPKAVTEELEYDFGKQAQYETGRHTFMIYNKGEATLELTQGESSCKCTLGSMTKSSLEPGESTEVELEWTPEAASESSTSKKFRQYAVVYTNDPERKEIEFTVTGVIYKYFDVVPDRGWKVPEMTLQQTRTVKGRITSLGDPFKIESIETTKDNIKADFRELSETERTTFEVENGYEITVTVEPGFQYGNYEAFVILHTDYKGGTEVRVHLSGFIKGPFTFLKMTREKGVLFSSNAWILDMGSFLADEGRKVDMRVFVAELEEMPEGENFKVLSAETDLKFLRVNVTGDDQPAEGGRSEMQVQFEYIAGSPSIIRGSDNPVTVTFKTNHPQAEEFQIRVLFAAN